MRNITILRGDSGTGKSTIISLIEKKKRITGNSIRINSTARIEILPLSIDDLKEFDEDIIYIGDENIQYYGTDRFSNFIESTGCYFVLITRSCYPSIPCSVHSLYKLDTSYYDGLYQTINVNMLTNNFDYKRFEGGEVYTEDKGSGYSIFSKIYTTPPYEVIPCGGNSNVYKTIINSNDNLIIIVDGAAFGMFVEDVHNFIKQYSGHAVLWMPESFEYLLIKSGMINTRECKLIIKNPYKYIDYKEYYTWERYFTNLLKTECSKLGLHYSKSSMDSVFYSNDNLVRFTSVIPEYIRP